MGGWVMQGARPDMWDISGRGSMLIAPLGLEQVWNSYATGLNFGNALTYRNKRHVKELVMLSRCLRYCRHQSKPLDLARVLKV